MPVIFENALRERFRLVGMCPRQALNAGYLLIDARIVFHGAGAKRIQAQVDGVVVRGEAREVTDGFHFAHFGKALDFRARVGCAERGCGVDIGNIQGRQLIATLARRAVFKQQRLILIDMLANFLNHFANTSATVSNLSRRDISVAQRSMVSFSSG
jgi:hypothetical protein